MQIIGTTSNRVFNIYQHNGIGFGPFWTYSYTEQSRGKILTLHPSHCYKSEQHQSAEAAIAAAQAADANLARLEAVQADYAAQTELARSAPVAQVDLTYRHLQSGPVQRCRCCGHVSGRFTTLPASSRTCDDCA